MGRTRTVRVRPLGATWPTVRVHGRDKPGAAVPAHGRATRIITVRNHYCTWEPLHGRRLTRRFRVWSRGRVCRPTPTGTMAGPINGVAAEDGQSGAVRREARLPSGNGDVAPRGTGKGTTRRPEPADERHGVRAIGKNKRRKTKGRRTGAGGLGFRRSPRSGTPPSPPAGRDRLHAYPVARRVWAVRPGVPVSRCRWGRSDRRSAEVGPSRVIVAVASSRVHAHIESDGGAGARQA